MKSNNSFSLKIFFELISAFSIVFSILWGISVEKHKNEWDKKVIDWDILCNEYFRILKPTGNLIFFQGWTNVSETKSILEKKSLVNPSLFV
jgi:hypothetical protein